MYAPVTNTSPVTAYLTPDGTLLGRSSQGGPEEFQAALNRALNMRFNFSQSGNTYPLAMGWTAPSLSSPYGYGMGSGSTYSINQSSSLTSSSMLGSGSSMGYGLGYGSAYGLGYGSGSYGYNPLTTSVGWKASPTTTPWTGSVPAYWLNSSYGYSGTGQTSGPGDNFANIMPTTRSSGASYSSVSSSSRVSSGERVGDSLPAGEYGYQEVGEIDRAPMAMFEHNGELLISAITRNGMDETPIWSYSEKDGVQRRGALPEQAESGHYGYSFGDGFHLTPESWGGCKDYVASSPDGPYIEQDYTYLVPHDYKNLKWGFSYISEATGRQFMGFGNAGHSGMVITYGNGGWQLFSAPEDMRFPTGLGVVTGGANDGKVLVSSAYGGTRIHEVDQDGNTRLVTTFDGWGVLRADQNARRFYTTTDQGKVYWASFDDPDTWKEAKYQSPSGSLDKIQGFGEPAIHPQTGRMIFPAMNQGSGATWFYEASMDGDNVVLTEVLYIEGAGAWAGKMAAVGDKLYYGTGRATGQAADQTPGVIYEISAG